jgi:hypothetical protein
MIILTSTHEKEVEKLKSQIERAERRERVYNNLMYFRTNLLRYNGDPYKNGFLLYNGSVISFERVPFEGFRDRMDKNLNYNKECSLLFMKLLQLEHQCFEAIRTGQDDLKTLENLSDQFHETLEEVNKISAKYI